MSDPFSVALRAELDAVVARYEALSKTHQEALSAARDSEATELRQTIAGFEIERASWKDTERELGEKNAALLKEISKAREAAAALETKLNEKIRGLEGKLSDALREVDRQRELAKEANDRASNALAESQRRIGQLEAQVGSVTRDVRSLEEAFVNERAFVSAAQAVGQEPLGEALRSVCEQSRDSSPVAYAALKARGLDAVLLAALKERGRSMALPKLSATELDGLKQLAAAAMCELIVVEAGTRFSGSSMERAASEPNPAEEGNVLECWIPGLRLKGTDGALLFPRVLVAS